MWVFILAAKNDAFRAFKKFKFLTENKTEYKIKTLRTDRGGEFLSTEFTQFCENEGIERHLTTPYIPQQNGVMERRNRTVMVMARSLLKGERTLFEAWMGRKPHLAHLRVFGCVAYVKNAAPHLKKLDDKSSLMVYLGVEEGCKAHRLFNPRHDKLQVSRDVMFQENCEWTWNTGANNEEKVPAFMVVDAFGTDEVIVVADIEAAAEDVTTPAVAMVPMTGASSLSTPSSNTHTASSPSITNSPESYEGPVHFRSIADIYTNTKEWLVLMKKRGEVMMVISEEPTCYQEAATETCCRRVEDSGAFIVRGRVHGSRNCGLPCFVVEEACQRINRGQIMVEFVNTGEQRADALTKALSGVKLAAMRHLLGVRDLQPCQD
ncbi:hypothetical protein ZIOFF_034808 [Zingiber officinale]|uniref:Integrase catalytic domain-containing protein n=1 Tax=Zingiber officinale TaxID=94328 RepID=A0A8J5KZZ9_ZINOF|nr:hypothetical protein ZIOFF_034808 [Zingiber officinale]